MKGKIRRNATIVVHISPRQQIILILNLFAIHPALSDYTSYLISFEVMFSPILFA